MKPMVRKGLLLAIVVFAGACSGLSVPASSVASGTVSWTVHSISEPTQFAASDATVCASEERCDRYQLVVLNSGDEPSGGGLAVQDRLPKGIRPAGSESGTGGEGGEWGCSETEVASEEWIVRCTFGEAIAPGAYAPFLGIRVSSPTEAMSGVLVDTVSVSGGGATHAVTRAVSTPVNSSPQQFGIADFSMEADDVSGAPADRAGEHPWEITTSFGVPWVASSPGSKGWLFTSEEYIRKVSVELPLGLTGNPLSVERCTYAELTSQSCPAGSEIGSLAVAGGAFPTGVFETTSTGYASPVYNMTPEGGYPAEFAFEYALQPIYLYVTVGRSSSGDRLRVTTPSVPSALGTGDVSLTLWGEPGLLNGSGSEAAFLSDPSSCGSGPGRARVEVESWEDPGREVSAETQVFPEVSGCGLVSGVFSPSLSVGRGPEGDSQADEPSGFEGVLGVRQPLGFGELGAPPAEGLSASLPVGVSLSASAAQGLVGCPATGPDGINLGSSDVAGDGEDLGDPEATEFGAGHAGGDGSKYDDGQWHTAPGHCPEASIVGSVEIVSPVIEHPLKGHLYLAEPECGGSGQEACTEEDATDGKLYSGYVEAEGSGVLIKERGELSVDPVTGQVTLHASGLPQLPFSELKIGLHGGPRAPLANPQGCGQFAAGGVITPWSGGAGVDVSASLFSVDWNGGGEGCPAVAPLAPGFTAGSVDPAAGASSSFTLQLTRQDREQDISALSVTLPEGLVGKIAGVPLCGEVEANAGSCPSSSEIGEVSVEAGSGPDPLVIRGGKAFLTGAYAGQPFGLSVVVPAVAGPFNLGNVVVRASIHIDPATAQVTVTTGPLPQSRDGVPFRLREIDVEVTRGGFMINPTDCEQLHVTGTVAGSGGSTAALSSPFAVAGCASLPFKPVLSASVAGYASKASGASLDLKVSSAPGQANIGKLKLDLPIQLPSRDSTLQKACLAAVFAANPAACPKESDVGTATAVTPVLSAPLSGPAYLVSYGSAAFPDLEIVLQGEGVTVILDTKTDIKKGVTSSALRSSPDAPISSFELKLPTGKFSLLTAYLPAKAKFDVCGQKLVMPTELTGQNGAVVKQSTPITVTGCPKPKPKPKAKKTKAKAKKSSTTGAGGR